jgi:hypothetical protein
MKAKIFLSSLSFLLLLQPLAISQGSAQALGQTQDRPPVVFRAERQSTEGRSHPSKPNILFVAIDDFNDWGPTQLDGAPFEVDTPNFDALADRGILFTNAHCNAPSCNPSRTSIMSGLHPASTGVYANGHDASRQDLDESQETSFPDDFDQRPPPQWEEVQWDQRPMGDPTVPQTLADPDIDQRPSEHSEERQWDQTPPCWSDTPLGQWAIEVNRWDGIDPIPPDDEPVFYAD